MGLPTYVVNWDELKQELENNIQIETDEIALNTNNLEKLFEEYFPSIYDLLEKLNDKFKKPVGDSKVIGFKKRIGLNNSENIIKYEFPQDCVINGFSFYATKFDEKDKISIHLVEKQNPANTIRLMYNVSLKNCLQNKKFVSPMPVTPNYSLYIEYHNQSNRQKTLLVDMDFMVPRSILNSNGSVIIKYIGKNLDGSISVLDQEIKTDLQLGVLHTFSNDKSFSRYEKLNPISSFLQLENDNPTKIIEFYFKEKGLNPPNTKNPFIQMYLEWNPKWVELELVGVLSDIRMKIDKNNPLYQEDSNNKILLMHNKNQKYMKKDKAQPNAIVEGLKEQRLFLYIINANERALDEENIKLSLDFYYDENKKITRVIEIESKKLDINSTKAVYVCDINLPIFNTGDENKLDECLIIKNENMSKESLKQF